MRSIVILMASNRKPRIRGDASISLGTKFLDRQSPTSQDWRVLASHFGFPDAWIQKIESVCSPTGKSPTVNVLRAWQERFPVTEALPVHEQLVDCLWRMNRIDAASWVEQMMEEGTFLDPQCETHSPNGLSGWVPRSRSQTNDSTRGSKKSAQENSCYDYDYWPTSQMYQQPHQPHQPKNGQSVVSLHSDVSDKSENLPMPSHRNNTNTWPWPLKHGKKGEHIHSSAQDRYLSPSFSNRGEIQHHFDPMERESLNYHQQLSQDDDGRPFHSLVSTTSEDVHRHCGDDRVCAAYGPCSHGTVDPMMMDNPTRASPLKRDSVLITYAYKNYKTAHNLAKLLIDRGSEVQVDRKEPIKGSTFASVTFVIIIYTQEYFQEVSGIKQSSLHTRLIWDLMAKEYNRRGNRNLRFVPIFDYERIDRTSIPDFLRNYPKKMAQYICNILTDTPKHGEISIQRKVY